MSDRSTPLSLQSGFCLLACSPRRGGNTDAAAILLASSLAQWSTSGNAGEIIRVADRTVQPCISCGQCETQPGSCLLDRKRAGKFGDGRQDEALPLLYRLCHASIACVISPIYFYHLPAQAKALMDRTQCFWTLPPEHRPGEGKRLGVILLGARLRGEKLFSGALLSLRFMAEALGLTLAEPLLLYGLDRVGELERSPQAMQQVRDYGRVLADLP